MANLLKWDLANSVVYECRQQQTMNHIEDTCRSTKSQGILQTFHEVEQVRTISK